MIATMRLILRPPVAEAALGFIFRPELGYVDPDCPPEDNPTTVWSMDAPHA